ncbi:universal stress protein [Paludisphaera mucosa]|uniref:Universal stress protein n=1 Tax=Paludisphaera mucosa TaxID=3030827 RepID=A0ABT6F663_9BACT|nr:universal stress protein [Paludisphaera mucosa]MDG3002875.1 universal stress protein [Paludisphaera mucosa]
MIAIGRILAPSDFSSHCEQALRYACGLAEKFDAELHVIHVLSDLVPASPDQLLMPVMPPQFYEDDEKRAALTLGDAVKPEWGTPRSLTTSVRWGTPAEAIVDYAAEKKVDLVVIATHGRTGLSHALLGSVAERIVREAPCPVLTIRSAPAEAS